MLSEIIVPLQYQMNICVMCKFSNESKEKLGNTIIYIAKHTKKLSKTKLLKLLFLMEERMTKQYHVPFLAIPYEVWSMGPVAKDVFIDLSDGPYLLKDYVSTETQDGCTYIKASKEFNDDEFSECEIQMMDDVLKHYGEMNAKQLVEETHKVGSLWRNKAIENDLLKSFKDGTANNSDVIIDFSEGMAPCSKEDYLESLNIHQTANILKAHAHV